jgi:hypothetical protein
MRIANCGSLPPGFGGRPGPRLLILWDTFFAFFICDPSRFMGYKFSGEKEGAQQMEKAQPRKIRTDLTPEEKERLEKFGSVNFKSAGATRKR